MNLIIKKGAVIAFRILVILVLVEGGLRLSGYLHLKYENSSENSSQADYYILILGDSMSYGGPEAWPRQLEQIINNGSETRFKVFNQAIPGATSSDIVSKLDENINLYSPKMVIVMMGILDPQNSSLLDDLPETRTKAIIKDLRVYKLFISLWDSLTGKFDGPGLFQDKKQRKECYGDQRDFIGLQEAVVAEEFNVSIKIDFCNLPLGYIQLGKIYSKNNLTAEAIKMFQKSLELNPNNINATFELAILSLKKNQSVGITDINRSSYLVEEGRVLMEARRIQEAELKFKEAAILNPANHWAYFNLARLHHDFRDDFEEAARMMKIVISLQPDIVEAHNGLLEISILAGDHDGVIEQTRWLIKKNLRNDELYVSLGAEYSFLGQHRQAIDALEQALSINPSNEMGLSILLKSYFEIGDYKKAADFGEELISKNYSIAGIYRITGHSYAKLNQQKKAASLLKKAERQASDESFGFLGYEWLGEAYADADLPDDAEKMFRKAIELEPRNPKAYVGLTWLFLSQNRFEKAQELLKSIEDYSDFLALIYSNVGNHYQSQNKTLEAGIWYDKVMEIKSRGRSLTLKNYQKLYDTLHKKNIPVIILQYPLVNDTLLETFFLSKEGVVVIKNENNFVDALQQYTYSELFNDHQYGSFGHLTELGHWIVAQEAATAIIPELAETTKKS